MQLHDKDFIEKQRQVTQPDFFLFTPKSKEYESDNVHLHIVEHEQYDGLIAFWTQSSFEGTGDNHIVMAFSKDDGLTWTEPQYICGTVRGNGNKDKQASWAVPIVSKSGRIYLLYFKETDFVDNSRQITGLLVGIYSDDLGKTWSEETELPIRITPYDANKAQNNCIFQIPFRDPNGKYLLGYTKWTSYNVRKPEREWCFEDSRVYFIRFENIDEDPEIENIKITELPDDINGVEMPFDDTTSSCQEPAPIYLPDGRIFCSCRTALGYAVYTVSSDDGHTWTTPKPIRFDDGSVMVNPLAPCPIYDVGDGRYMQLFHNKAEIISLNRETLWRVFGTFDPDAEQPICFKKGTEEIYMELGEEKNAVGKPALAMYGCMTKRNGKPIHWYPDRKFFLLGREIK